MRDGKFTDAEREYLLALDAVRDVSGGQIQYADAFKIEAMARYRLGERPKATFESAGLLMEMLGYKRVERPFARWRENDLEDILTRNLEAGAARHDDASAHKRGGKPVAEKDETKKLIKEKDGTIACQAREIGRLKMEVGGFKGAEAAGDEARRRREDPLEAG